MLDDYGHYMTYGEAVNADEMRASAFCPKASSRAASSSATCRRTSHSPTTTSSCRPAGSWIDCAPNRK